MVAIGGHWLVSLLLSLAVITALSWRQLHGGGAPSAIRRILLLLLLVRFAIPVAALGSDAAFRWFLADRYADSQAALTLSSEQVIELAQPESPAPTSVAQSMRRWWNETSEAFDVDKRLAALKETATRVTEHVVELIVIFLLQTMIVPSLLLWAAWRAALALATRPPSDQERISLLRGPI